MKQNSNSINSWLGRLAIFVVCLASTFALPQRAWADDSGSCGTNVTYSYVESTHTLTISGTGEMADFSSKDNQPWKDDRDNITTVVVRSGVTSIGSHAFEGCSSLKDVLVLRSESVTSLGSNAFDGCFELANIYVLNEDCKTATNWSGYEEKLVPSVNYSQLKAEVEGEAEEIKLQAPAYYIYDGESEIINLFSSCTIDGNGSTINMLGASSPAFELSAEDITIKNFRIVNTNSESDDGAICVDGSGCKVEGCFFFNNGKAIYEVNVEEPGVEHVAVNNCWFGNTKDDYNVAPANAGVDLDNWLFLDAAVSSATLKVLEPADVKYIFSSYDGTTVSEFDSSQLPAVNLSLTATNGDVDKTTTLGETIQYVATEHGKGSVTAKIESVSYTISFTNNLNDAGLSVSAQDITCIEDETLTITLENIPDNQPVCTATGKLEVTLTSDVFSGSKEINLGETIETSLEGHKVTIQSKSSDNDVKTTFTIADLPAGSYGVTVKYSGDYVFNEATSNASFTVTKAPTVITVEKATLELKVGDEIATGASLTPAEAGSLVYTSGNEQVAVVKEGNITALAEGTATITVSYAGTDKYAAAESKTIAVTVTLNESSVSVNNLPPDGSCLYVDDTFVLIPTTTPAGLAVAYIPDNSGVVSVDENGVITALKEGTASITVKVGGDGVYAESSTTVTLTVVYPTMTVTLPAGLSTYYDNVGVRVSDSQAEGVKMYAVTAVNGDQVTLKQLPSRTIPANTPVIISNTGSEALDCQFDYTTDDTGKVLFASTLADDLGVANAEAISSALSSSFVGTAENIDAYEPANGATLYGLNGEAFVKLDAKPNIPANRCWLEIPGIASAGTRTLTIVFGDGDTTSLDAAKRQTEEGTANWYSLDGRKLDGTPKAKGLYIMNGKKVIIKK